MLPEVWGPIVWYNFHILSYSFDVNEKQRYIRFFKSIPYILPCIVCTDHFKLALASYPSEKNCINQKKIVTWLCDIHNIVNIRLYKKIYTVKQIYKIYHDKNDNLIIYHTQMVSFLKLVKKYLMSGISPIVFFHSQNILINYCHICPCQKCKLGLITLITNTTNTKGTLVILVNRMLKIINNCNKSISSNKNLDINLKIKIKKKINKTIIKNNNNTVLIDDNNNKIPIDDNNKILIDDNNNKIPIDDNNNTLIEDNNNTPIEDDNNNNNKILIEDNITVSNSRNLDLSKFIANQNVLTIKRGKKLKIICKQNNSTPGIKTIITVIPNKKYKIYIDVEANLKLFFWIKDLKTNKIIKYNNLDNIVYDNNNIKRISVGISIHNPKHNDIFYLKKFIINCE